MIYNGYSPICFPNRSSNIGKISSESTQFISLIAHSFIHSDGATAQFRALASSSFSPQISRSIAIVLQFLILQMPLESLSPFSSHLALGP